METTQNRENPPMPLWIKLRIQHGYASEEECVLLTKENNSRSGMSANSDLLEYMSDSAENIAPDCRANCLESCKGCGGGGKSIG